MSPINDPQRARRRFILAGCVLCLAGLGWLDYATGYELGFFVFYSVPVGFAAWYVGRGPAIALALQATVAWLLADYFGGVKYSSRFFYYWNGVIHFTAFVINAITIAKIKNDLDQRHRLAQELAATQAKLHALAATLTFCPACGSPHDGRGQKSEADVRAWVANHPELTGSLCNGCRTNVSQSPDPLERV